MVLWTSGVDDYSTHNSFLFLELSDCWPITLTVMIPGKSNNQKIEKFALVFREYNTEKKKLSSPQFTLKYPFSKSFFSSNDDVTSCDTKYDFWFTKEGISGVKFYYSTVTFNLSKLPLSEKKIYDVSLKYENNYHHKYYITFAPKTEFVWTNFREERSVGDCLFKFGYGLCETIGYEEAERAKFRLYLRMLAERGNIQTPITQMLFDGKAIEFKNISDSLLEEEPSLLKLLFDDPLYLKRYALKNFELGDKYDSILRLSFGGGNYGSEGQWFQDILETTKPNQKSLINAVNYYNIRNVTGELPIFTTDDVVVFYTILKPLLSNLENDKAP